jgi:hypothetical protein
MECGDVISWPMDTDLPVDLRLLQLLLPRKGLMCTTARTRCVWSRAVDIFGIVGLLEHRPGI